MSAKDLFSSHSKIYAAFRPTYPKPLYDFIFQRVSKFDRAWDCATGNGQVAQDLAAHFHQVEATDLSQKQIEEAHQASNISYSVSAAEQTTFPNAYFDLITVGQALHWIDIDKFYKEARRVGNERSVLAVWGYSLLSIDPAIDRPFLNFYHNVVGPYWDTARRLVEQEYATIAFPFGNVQQGRFEISVEWTREQFAGYLTSWSATQKFIRDRQEDPVPALIRSLDQSWAAETSRRVVFPLFAKVGNVHP